MRKEIHLTCRASDKNMKEEEIEFIKEQLEFNSKSNFVKQAIRIYYKYHTGELFKDILDKIDITDIKEDDEIHNQINKKIDKGFF